MSIRRIGIIQKTYSQAKRYREIVSVFLKYGFDEIIERMDIESYIDIGLKLIKKPPRSTEDSLSTGERIRLALEELGPTFIKFGQILSTQADVLPKDIVDELEKLQSSVPPFEYKFVKKIIEEELNQELDVLFQEFSKEPLAAASIGQVHEATLHDGEEVVVKVQRPAIQKVIETDLEIMYHLASLLEAHVKGMETAQPTKLVERFGRTIRKEIDFQNEAANIDRFASQFSEDDFIYTPKVWIEYSSERVLTMEKITGIRPNNVQEMEEKGIDPAVISQKCYVRIIQQILDYGFFHADPHPGNAFVLSKETVAYIDYGMMGTLSQMEREIFGDLIMAIASKNTPNASRALIRLTDWQEEPDKQRLQRAIDEFIDIHLNKSLKQVELSAVLQDLMDLLVDHGMRLPQSMLLVIKALSTVEGIGRKLDPEFDPIEQAKPTVIKIQRRRYSPDKLLAYGYETVIELTRLLKELPEQIHDMLNQLQAGRTKLSIHLTDLHPLLSSLIRTSNLLAMAILTGSLVIGSSLMVHSKIPPRIGEIPVIGIIGFLLSGIFTIYLLYILVRQTND